MVFKQLHLAGEPKILIQSFNISCGQFLTIIAMNFNSKDFCII